MRKKSENFCDCPFQSKRRGDLGRPKYSAFRRHGTHRSATLTSKCGPMNAKAAGMCRGTSGGAWEHLGQFRSCRGAQS